MKGYQIIAIDTESTDYTRLAYACALSIKVTQPEGFDRVSIVTNNVDKAKEYKVFDDVVNYQGPIGMDARSRSLDYAIYDETVLIDSDMLFLKDMSYYWELLSNKELFISTSPKTFEGNRFKYGYYRKVFEQNGLADVYNAWTYYKKDSKKAKDFFNVVKLITDNPSNFIENLKNAGHMKSLPTDEAFAIALGILDIEEESTCYDFPSITHMKGMVQGWSTPVLDWTERLRLNLNQQAQVKLGVWSQHEILHYVDKNVITDSMIKTLEGIYARR